MPARTKHHTLRLLAVATLMSLAATAGAQATKTKKLYCWNDSTGHKVCGDALPAELAGSSRTEFNSTSGMRTGEIARAMTPEERAAAEKAAADAAAQAEIDAARARREMAMVESYATEADLRKAFQERIDLLEETLKASELSVVGLRASLVGLLRQAGDLELAGKSVPFNARTNIAAQHTELRRRERIYAQQKIERAQLDEELASVLQRYRDLKDGVRPTAAEAAATAAAPPQG
ncbi:hypothetical protein LVB87_05375 [Lysobacter sp. KIS68-7]|uniref:hypothetical protein n=1 Tax=Lysobacter sp. KIS68-7 TaxID=2904252 RepID=UPI001E4AFC00|nr:hypothetical protein [Lysobacter sp. KIS68-7]UHQ20585.1 hypothetical protein LVB87_05375 [Lysobacter sp. KIS68-7]